MKISNTSILIDKRTNCHSMIVEVKLGDYLDLIKKVYDQKGGLELQREPLKTSSAQRIRRQMIKDILVGTVLPPIVIGLIKQDFDSAGFNISVLEKLLKKTDHSNLSIIDGMQRTTALYKAVEEGANIENNIRVEFWIANKLNSLIYRMLVLNTGQVPWNLRRQIETVFEPMIKEINNKTKNADIYTINDSRRRSQPGQYHGKDVVELYLAFGARKEMIDTKERLADEFTKLDFIEATESPEFSNLFYETFNKLVQFDFQISRLKSENNERFSNGVDLFKSQPAKVGFITAASKKILGRPGAEKANSKINEDAQIVFNQLDKFISKLENIKVQDLEKFIAFPVLNEKLNIKTSRVGDFERQYFVKAFETLIEEGDNLNSLDIAWLAF